MKKRTSSLRPSSSNEEARSGTVMISTQSFNSEEIPNAANALIRCITMSQHSHNLLKFLNEDRGRQRFCDVSVSVGGKIYCAHKAVLAHGSSYFHAEFSKNPQATHVTLDHVEEPVFQHLLEFLYTSECIITETDIPTLIAAARFLDMMDILKLLSEDAQSKSNNAPAELTSGDLSADPKYIEDACNSESPSSEGLLDSKTVIQVIPENHNPAPIRRSSHRKSALKYKTDNESESIVNKRTKVLKKSVVEEGKEANFDAEIVANNPHIQDENEDVEQDDDAAELDAGQLKTQSRHNSEKTNAVNMKAKSRSTIQEYPEGLAPVIIQTASKKTLKCPKCDKVFDRAAKYESHTRVHTGEKPFQCEICQQCYSTKSNLTVHKKKHHNDSICSKKEHQCPVCNKLHASKKTLAKHIRRFHPDHIQENKKRKRSEGWKCAICQKTFTRRPHLQEHMILHSQELPFKCTFCDQYFKSRFARLKHQEKSHLGPFPCEICGRQFNDSGNKRRHIECTHGGKRKWTCFVCGKSVRERTTLREHMRIHSGEKPHLCSVCGQSFRHGSSYRLHLRVHHNDKRYECIQCGKTFIRHDHLSKHQKIHSGEKAHQCEECGKCFRRHDHLTVHYKTVHLGQKVWQKYKTAVHQCEVCKKEFKGRSSLESHFRTHSGEKPHKCPECHQSFRIKKTLTKHMVIHSEERPYNCPHCSAAFKRKDKLKYHVDHVHNTRYTVQPVGNLSQDKLDPASYVETTKAFNEAKSSIHSSPSPASPRVPATLRAVSMADTGQASGQQPNYPSTTDLAFLEKYTLNPQPANVLHPVRPDQMLDPREQSYLGTLLGLDSATSVQSVANSKEN
ncbi:zinc finger and BTB domain-containing protein 41 [Periophthalmus magnuspinnatus]|uniref:zinc finger and BTB domain-containing protein 41 n=1 Tax=Periophthalmus magnuspinnatus TaxID=409849 RepID=UPI00145BB032|nr:zinc finger and BTB domain-containing protein 41 [Periophthalmus magnuspinnatus]